jgi:RimJ/RimL family protein N-acetyltransferase
MDKDITFPINLPDLTFTIEGLIPADAPRLQSLYEACSDYIILEQGEPPTPNAAELEFSALPPNRTTDNKFMFGLVDTGGTIVGLLECNRGYPDEECWWVGLFMLNPRQRGKGIAQTFFEAFTRWVASQSAKRLELAVITTNERAYRFWKAQGFDIIRTTDPKPYGRNYHRLHVMRRLL